MRLAGLGLATAALLASATANATDLRLSTWVPPQHPLQTTGLEPWIKSMNEASGGKINVTIFPAQQLGSAIDHYDMAANGIADITYVNPGYQPGRFPVIALGEQPFMATNAVGGTKAFDKWYRAYAEKEMSDVHVCMAFLHDTGTIHSTKPVQVPADMKGMNVRPGNATMGRFVSLLGGSSVQVSAPEAREVLARGAADAITFPWGSIYLFGINEVTKHHIDMPLYTTTFVMAVNKAAYEGMPDDERKVFDDHCTSEWAQKVAEGWANWEAAGRDKAKSESDQIVYEPTESDMALWHEAAAPLMDDWRKEVTDAGYDPDAVYNALVGNLKAEGAYAE
ncbi:TRAP transporter substrate-binding protein [Rhizobium sp. L1K21]|uniref:TRAP transporter substrate-binding protein n=1 Tax=Rhizobium sp. L1K21 TaxID=2954933 RepID=UPI002093A9BD|nr:TRAP transporter substrate-binding protein [Rhizobium sp. L1K21]MCO6188557.1 TRAP transporter substrate-binding protein [Rhizobium sp. L1K21]